MEPERRPGPKIKSPKKHKGREVLSPARSTFPARVQTRSNAPYSRNAMTTSPGNVVVPVARSAASRLRVLISSRGPRLVLRRQVLRLRAQTASKRGPAGLAVAPSKREGEKNEGSSPGRSRLLPHARTAREEPHRRTKGCSGHGNVHGRHTSHLSRRRAMQHLGLAVCLASVTRLLPPAVAHDLRMAPMTANCTQKCMNTQICK